jgi:hypothetical protein
MIRDIEVLDEIKEIRKKTEFLKNPLVNDFCGSYFWGDIDERLEQIEKDIETNLKLFHII